MSGVYGDWRQWFFVLLVFLSGVVFVWFALHWYDEDIRKIREYDPCASYGNVTEAQISANNIYCSFRYAEAQNAKKCSSPDGVVMSYAKNGVCS